MEFQYKSFSTLESLKEHVKGDSASLYLSARTSTVLPEARLKDLSADGSIVDLTAMPVSFTWLDECRVKIEGPLTWQQCMDHTARENRLMPPGPTELSACVLASIATSATGEESFGSGTLRDYVESIELVNHEGELITLTGEELPESLALSEYQKEWNRYQSFKNGPFPRLVSEIDLAIGMEGQLGVIVSAVMKTRAKRELDFFMLSLPRWQDNYEQHENIYYWAQTKRAILQVCELLDHECLNFCKDMFPDTFDGDVLVLSVDSLEAEAALSELCELVLPEKIFSIDESKFHNIRLRIPRAINESIALSGQVKKGTDAQFHSGDFKTVFELYREMDKLDVASYLFGHFGDLHLHFNFLPNAEQLPLINKRLERFYDRVVELKGSPFAEHGVGTLKKSYHSLFLGPEQLKVFKKLKEVYDPTNKFFPWGFLNHE
jgi:glycolate oxidase